MKDIVFELCVVCATYNHSHFVTDALNGFAIQNTIFPYVCVIVDDASTDGNKDIINDYLAVNFDNCNVEREETDDYTLIFVRHKSNLNCFFAVFFLKYNHFSNPEINKRRKAYYARFFNSAKYNAFCEGDDYWTHKDFLQIAVNFLNANPSYSAVFGNKIVCDRDGNIVNRCVFKNDLTVKDIMRGENMGIRNLIFRKEIRDVKPFVNKTRDIYIYYQCASSGKLKYFNEDFAIYRLTGEGVYSKLDKKRIIETSYEHYYEFHRALNFRYQKQLVEYQMGFVSKYLGQKDYFKICQSLIKKYHVPSPKRYVWYMFYSARMIVGWAKRKLFK